MSELTKEAKKFLKGYGLKHGRDYQYIDEKARWEIGAVITPDTNYYFQTVTSKDLQAITQEGGLIPENRKEVNFTRDRENVLTPILFPKKPLNEGGMVPAFKFIFAFPAETDEPKWSKSLEMLGWLPEKNGDSTYMHIFKVPGVTEYASTGGNISTSQEIAFPLTIEASWIEKSYLIEKKNSRFETSEV